MRITKVSIPESPEVGLKSISMSKLDKLVLIAGKNGAGKSRILEKIKLTISKIPTTDEITQLTHNKGIYQESREQLTAQEIQLTRRGEKLSERQQSNLEDSELQLRTILARLKWSQLETSKTSKSYKYIDFVPKNLNLKDCNALNKRELINHANSMDEAGIENAAGSAFAKIQHIQDQWFNATHQHSTLAKAETEEIIKKYHNLQSYIDLFLKTTLERDINGDATLFNLPLGKTQLSDGQKVILQLCIALYSQKEKLNELIIFMDEPENHLHPQALLEVIDNLLSVLTDGQLWIATHSINLLAHHDPQFIWYVEDGEIKYSGNLPERVLEGLLGNEEEILKLSNFLSLPAQMATERFSFESLFAPLTLTTGPNDPQTNQIIQKIQLLRNDGKKLGVLDFGAGKCRLLSTIRELTIETTTSIPDWLEYFAFDMPSDDESQCKALINSIYSDARFRYFNSEKDLLESIPQKSLDIIVLCNVFHEIDPKDWLTLFSKNNIIRSCLRDDGTLLIVEDQLIPVGEKAYPNGFLVLDKIQFKKLFKLTNDYPMQDARNDGRLRAHSIPANAVGNVDSASRIEAITDLAETAKREVRRIRGEAASYKNGKLHGFWVQQLANAQLALSELSN
ncbi:hypothetical protein D0C16_20845 [Cellvibrio sp. KY-GH-1]|uniref:AAA family ATPase n=1 Tax=Cellvibrio sp. KY-GH-1 TaxID=2303332 RepID=UPI001244B4D6|nr:AAA family ATPase [Cellvibrio sp. KY-GH-1]QEY18215.1 hypothetical protein D0C16_20845 [Cellvibrio sp. KY-GH-1]